jgi:GNAT superfamily N-acetyltransferase
MAQFRIRDSTQDPEKDIAAALSIADSTLPHLATIGSEGQWGSQPFSQRPKSVQMIRDTVYQAERYRTTGEGPAKRIYLAEVQMDGEMKTVGFVTVHEDWFADYVEPRDEYQEAVREAKALPQGWTYLHALYSDFSAPPEVRRGCGAVLVDKVKEHVRALGKDLVFVDCYNGNSQKLVRYGFFDFFFFKFFLFFTPFFVYGPFCGAMH